MRLKKLAICCVSAVLICASMIMRTDCVHANAVDKLTIKLGYFGWQPSEYVEKAVFPASDLYDRSVEEWMELFLFRFEFW